MEPEKEKLEWECVVAEKRRKGNGGWSNHPFKCWWKC